MNPALDPRPSWACLLCPPPRKAGHWYPADPEYHTCGACVDRIRDRLIDRPQRHLPTGEVIPPTVSIPARWAQLDPRRGSGHSGERGAPGFGSRSPASEHIIAMTDVRSSSVARMWWGSDGRQHAEPENPPLAVRNVLATLAWGIAEGRGLAESAGERLDSADVPTLAKWIEGHLDWVTRQADVVEFDDALRHLDAQLRPVTGEPGRSCIGLCPTQIQEEGEPPRRCGRRLYVPRTGDTVECWPSGCGETWQRHQWLDLGDTLAVH